MTAGWARLNDRAREIADAMAADAEALRVTVAKGALGCRIIDAGADTLGGIEAGLRMAEAAMGGLGNVRATMNPASDRFPLSVEVRSSQPVLACLGSQYAGWSLSTDDYFAMGSGPARILARVEPLFQRISYTEHASTAVLILETAKAPPEAVVAKVAAATGLDPKALTFLFAPTQSLAGTVQIVCRVLEVALHKANDLGFALDRIVDGAATAPVPAPHPEFLTAMGRTNDAIIYGGLAQLFVRGPADDARDLAQKLTSRSSRDYGRPFAEIFKHFKGDFYAIDPLLFSPAEVIVTAIDTGETFRAGGRDPDLLARSLR